MRLAARTLIPADAAALFTVEGDHRAVFTVSLCNRTKGPIKVRLALTAAGQPPADADWLEYDAVLEPAAVLERTGLALDAGQHLFATADLAGVSAVVFGIQELK